MTVLDKDMVCCFLRHNVVFDDESKSDVGHMV